MAFYPFMFILIESVAVYVLLAVVCIANRMTKTTRPYLRVLVVLFAIFAMWGLLRSVMGDWPPTLAAYLHLAVLVLSAAYLLANPRIPTE